MNPLDSRAGTHSTILGGMGPRPWGTDPKPLLPCLRTELPLRRLEYRCRNAGRALITAGADGEPAGKELREPGLVAIQEPRLPHLPG